MNYMDLIYQILSVDNIYLYSKNVFRFMNKSIAD